ncbi:MAG TPA: DUF1707 domain-containing protein [Acidimicrobiales bacterium]|jgi:hypothetical protein|nr:DUF1707 domain-containing protein [Acidimicrobiales bacterium]
MRYRWDPAYPLGRRYGYPSDTDLRASDTERNEVADRLSRHFAEGRLDQTEFKNRLDTAMSATTRGELGGLFHDLPRLPAEPLPPPPRHRQVLPFLGVIAVVFIVAGATASVNGWYFFRIPWLLIAVVAFFLWHRAGRHSYRRHHRPDDTYPPSSVLGS